jgi:hypothetical protein
LLIFAANRTGLFVHVIVEIPACASAQGAHDEEGGGGGEPLCLFLPDFLAADGLGEQRAADLGLVHRLNRQAVCAGEGDDPFLERGGELGIAGRIGFEAIEFFNG